MQKPAACRRETETLMHAVVHERLHDIQYVFQEFVRKKVPYATSSNYQHVLAGKSIYIQFWNDISLATTLRSQQEVLRVLRYSDNSGKSERMDIREFLGSCRERMFWRRKSGFRVKKGTLRGTCACVRLAQPAMVGSPSHLSAPRVEMVVIEHNDKRHARRRSVRPRHFDHWRSRVDWGGSISIRALEPISAGA